MFQKDFPFGGKLYFFGAADKKSLVQLFFQNFDRLADCRLGDKELLGCFLKAERYCHMLKDFV